MYSKKNSNRFKYLLVEKQILISVWLTTILEKTTFNSVYYNISKTGERTHFHRLTYESVDPRAVPDSSTPPSPWVAGGWGGGVLVHHDLKY